MSGYYDATAGAVEHCQQMAQIFPDLAARYYEPLAEACRHSWWHQLTLTALEMVSQPQVTARMLHHDPALVMEDTTTATSTSTGSATAMHHNFLALYQKVIVPVEAKLHPLSLARITAAVAHVVAWHQPSALEEENPPDWVTGRNLLENLLAKKERLGPAATCYVQSKLALMTLHTYMYQVSHQQPPSAEARQATSLEATATTPDLVMDLTPIKELIRTNQVIVADLLSSASWSSSAGSHAPRRHQAHNTSSSSTGPAPGPPIAMGGTDQDPNMALVQAAHYEMAMTYYKIIGPPEAFYEQAMSFLNYAPLPSNTSSMRSTTEDEEPSEGGVSSPGSAAMGIEGETGTPRTTTTATTTSRASATATIHYPQLAMDLCLAALTGEGVYNLGQLEQAPILAFLGATTTTTGAASDEANAAGTHWLVHLLRACSAGDIVRFSQLTQEYADQIAQQPALVHRASAVQEKLALLALVQLVFEKPSHARNLTMTEIAQRLHISLDQVEWVVMRAFSVHLMEGSIDQVDGTVHVRWVMPRVLHRDQMLDLATKFGEWAARASQSKDFIHSHVPPSFAT